MCFGLNEVVGPDMVWPARPQSDARSTVEPEPALLGLLGWDLQPLTSPDALHSLVVHMPTFCPQESRDPAIAIATVLTGKVDDRRRQGVLV